MNPSKNKGFTIIETILFLAITGLLVVGLLVGTGASISEQRYRDSVSTFAALLQNQYSEVANVSNDRTDNLSCTNAKIKVGGSSEIKGQSNCFIAGRLIMIDTDIITTVDIVGAESGNVSGSDIEKLSENYNYGIFDLSKQQSSLEWGAKITWPVEGSGNKPVGTKRVMSLLLIRSPDSGSTYTFTSDSPLPLGDISSDWIKEMINPKNNPNGQDRRTICVDTATGRSAGNKMAVFISDNASNGSAIETRSYDTIRLLGGDTKC